jgi:hypothetical protein
MLVTLFSAKGSPGVTSSALALAAVWPRPVVLMEADPTGTDLVYRCRSAAGGPVAPAPNVLGLASAVRGDRSVSIGEWTQPLANGVWLVPGVTTPTQGRGLRRLWHAVAGAAASAEVDVIADVGRLAREDPTVPLVAGADLAVPVVSACLESLMHAREQLLELAGALSGRTVPLLVGRARTAAADTADLDEVLAGAGVMTAPATHLPLDHPGLSALEDGAGPAGRGRMSQLVRAARAVTDRVGAAVSVEAAR